MSSLKGLETGIAGGSKMHIDSSSLLLVKHLVGNTTELKNYVGPSSQSF